MAADSPLACEKSADDETQGAFMEVRHTLDTQREGLPYYSSSPLGKGGNSLGYELYEYH